MPQLVSVAVPVPLLPALTYRVPAGITMPKPGMRVRVPLGNRVVTGCVLAQEELDDHDAKALLECLDTEPFLPGPVLELALWAADYYACGPGEAVGAAMPPFAWGRNVPKRQQRTAFKTVRVVRLTNDGEKIVRGASAILGVRQRAALTMLASSPAGLVTSALSHQGVSNQTLRRLSDRGLVAFTVRQVERDPFDADGFEPTDGSFDSIELTSEQRTALDRLNNWAATGTFRVSLLHGVTGSGKTAVYLRLATEVRRRGRGVIVLVPEIALTPAIVRSFREACEGRVAVQHSGLSDGERHDQWHRIRRGDVDVVVGTRSGVFAPLENLGLIIVDEEHDSSYKQEESPRYHGRDVAVVRAQQAGALVVLGSATPSLESYHNTVKRRYERVVLSQRVLDRPLATVSVVDMRKEMAAHGSDVVLSTSLQEALSVRLSRKEQALILLNRRGYAAAMLCRQCGHTLECPNCSVSLTLHQAVGRVRCHYCNYSLARPVTCPHCAGAFLDRVGFGTERIESELADRFPEAVIARLDRDTIRRRGVVQELLNRFARREIDVLVGTQMVAKGHDFPAVTLVGVISADVGLGLADFRAAERTFQLLTQVAGRAGRGEMRGEAIVQTFYPEHYSIGFACQQQYEPFFRAEMRFRESMRYPPAMAMVNLIVRARTFTQAMTEATKLGNELRRVSVGYEVLGPAPAPMTRIRGEHRVQMFLKGTQRRGMRESVRLALKRYPALRRRVTVDVDPLTIL